MPVTVQTMISDLYRGRWAIAGERANAVVAREPAGTTNRIVALVALGRLRIRRGHGGAADTFSDHGSARIPVVCTAFAIASEPNRAASCSTVILARTTSKESS